MKNLQKGFVVPLIIAIIAVLAIGGGVYVYENKKEKTPAVNIQNTSYIKDITENSVKPINILSPTFENVLESGKTTKVIFSPVDNANKYVISITYPDNKSSSNITLFKTQTSSTNLDIVVPQTKGIYLGENSSNGERLLIQAYDNRDNLITIGETQIRILPSPNQPSLLKANKYVVSGNGDEVTLTFGILPKQFTKREVDISCVNTYTLASIDNEPCGKILTLGAGAYTKKLLIKRSIFQDRETAVIVGVRYYDSNNQEKNPSGIDDESFVSIKLGKATSIGSSVEEIKPTLSYVGQLQNEEVEKEKKCPSEGLKFFNSFVENKGQFPNTSNFNFDRVIGEPQYHYNKSISTCLIKLTHTISPLSDTIFVSQIRDVYSTKLLTHSVWASNKDLGEHPTKEEFDAEAKTLMSE